LNKTATEEAEENRIASEELAKEQLKQIEYTYPHRSTKSRPDPQENALEEEIRRIVRKELRPIVLDISTAIFLTLFILFFSLAVLVLILGNFPVFVAALGPTLASLAGALLFHREIHRVKERIKV
jgi:hypothetical protein